MPTQTFEVGQKVRIGFGRDSSGWEAEVLEPDNTERMVWHGSTKRVQHRVLVGWDIGPVKGLTDGEEEARRQTRYIENRRDQILSLEDWKPLEEERLERENARYRLKREMDAKRELFIEVAVREALFVWVSAPYTEQTDGDTLIERVVEIINQRFQPAYRWTDQLPAMVENMPHLVQKYQEKHNVTWKD